jgi:aspartyl-tRNA(Asn)/glutamyl-tRNA(Gln) amidotransferase subunit A
MPTLNQIALALESGASSSRSLVEECLARIDEPGGQGGKAFLRVYRDQAVASADAMDTLRRAGRAPGPFAGIPISLKDLFDVAGEQTLAASMILADAPPARAHAAIVKRLLSAGFIPIGRTNMTEFAFSGVGINPHFGTPLAPYDRGRERIPGGSSSGAAVSVSDGMAFAAIGTDTGGSCRIPAAFCGVVGYKPTARRVPLTGVLPLAPSLDSVGPLAGSVACCAVMDAVMAGEDAEADIPDIPLSALRLVLPTNVVLDGMDAATERSVDRAIGRLDAKGAQIDRRPLRTFETLQAIYGKGSFAAAEAFAWHRELLASKRHGYDPRVASRIAPGGQMSAADYMWIIDARRRLQRDFAAEIEAYDAMMMPTVAIAPPPLDAFAMDADYWRLNGLILRNTAIINFLDGCAISLPCHEADDPPAGLMLAAGAGQDHLLFALARAVERALCRAS